MSRADLYWCALVPCACCGRSVPRHALDTGGRCGDCPSADASLCIVRARIADARRIVPLCLALLFGRVLAPWDHAAMAERADAARDAVIAAMEAEGEDPPPPWSSQWDPAHDALVPGRVA